MTDILFPPGLAPANMVWSLVRNQQRSNNPYANTIQRNDRGGDVWTCRIEMPPLDSLESGLMSAWLDQISKAGNSGLVPVFQNSLEGTEAAAFTSLVPLFAQENISDWNANVGGLSATPYYQNGLVLFSGQLLSTTAFSIRSVNVITGLPYVFALDQAPQPIPGCMYVGNSNFSQLYFDNRMAPVAGRVTFAASSNDGGFAIALAPGNGTTDFVKSNFSSLSVNRCFASQAASAVGAANLTFYGGNSSFPDLAMRIGTFFEVLTSAGWELKRLSVDVDTVPGGSYGSVPVSHVGRATFVPALRGSVAFNAPIITHRPVCRMILNEAASTANISAPLRSGFAFEMIEIPNS